MRVLLTIILFLLSFSAHAQSTVVQSGTVTPGHAVRWISSGVVGDAGTAASGSLTSLGITNGGGPGLCINSGPITGAYNAFCLSASQTGGGVLSLDNYGGATGGFSIKLNGATQGLTTSILPTVVDQLACFADTTGTLKGCTLGGSPGILVQTGGGTLISRSIAGTSNEISVANGDGVSGNPTLSLPSALTFTGKTITAGTYVTPTFTGPTTATGLFGQTGTSSANTGATVFPRKLTWTVNAGLTDYVWADTVLFYNYDNATSNNNVARYTQSIKYGTGQTWGQVTEVIDNTETANPTGAMQAHEIDIAANGTDSGNTRSGISINALRKPGGSGVDMEVGTGLTFGGGLDPGHTTFNYGIYSFSNTTIKNALYFTSPITSFLLAGTDAATNFYITGAGSIGIGTSTPVRKIHLAAAGASDRFIRMSNSLNTSGLDVGVSSAAAGGYVFMNDNNPVYIATNALTRVVVAADGKVGIGSAAPTYQFDVAGTTNTVRLGNMLTGAWPNTTTSTFIGHNSLSQSAAGNYAVVQDASGATAINGATGQSVSLRINNSAYLLMDSTGKVGIGSGTAPSYTLDVNPTTSTVRLGDMLAGDFPFSTGTMFLGHNSLSQTVDGNYALTQDSSGATAINGASGQYVGIRIGGAAAVRIDSNKRVGIGTISPTTLLNVSAAADGTIGPTVTLLNPQASASAGTAAAIDFVTSSTTSFVGGRIQSIRTNRGASGDADIAFSTISSSSLTEKWRIKDMGFMTATSGSLGRAAPVTKTGDFTWAAGENWIIANKGSSMTVTLPSASTFSGRELMISTIQAFTVVSASSNVVPITGGAAGTAILAATAGKWATLVSDGTNWIIMHANWLLERDLNPAANDNSPVGLAKVG